MRKFIIRILKLLSKVKAIGRVISFTYQGRGVSNNDFYSSGHWSNRQQLKVKWRAIFTDLIKPAIGKYEFQSFYLLIFYKSRLDVDNVVGMEKLFTDTLKGTIIHDDGKKIFKGMMVFYDNSLPNHDTYEFVLIEANDEKPTNK